MRFGPGGHPSPNPNALPYDEPLPGILGEKVALTAYGTRYVTPKPPSGKTSTKGSSSGKDGGKPPAVVMAAPVAARPPALTATARALSQDPSSFTTTSTSTLAGEGLLLRPRSPSIDDLLRASGAAADEGEAICVDEGYGHDAMDHYDYGLDRCGRAVVACSSL